MVSWVKQVHTRCTLHICYLLLRRCQTLNYAPFQATISSVPQRLQLLLTHTGEQGYMRQWSEWVKWKVYTSWSFWIPWVVSVHHDHVHIKHLPWRLLHGLNQEYILKVWPLKVPYSTSLQVKNSFIHVKPLPHCQMRGTLLDLTNYFDSLTIYKLIV